MVSSIDTDQTAPSLSVWTLRIITQVVSGNKHSLTSLRFFWNLIVSNIWHANISGVSQLFDEVCIHCGDPEVKDNEEIRRLKEEHMGLWDPYVNYAEKQKSWLRREMHWKLKRLPCIFLVVLEWIASCFNYSIILTGRPSFCSFGYVWLPEKNMFFTSVSSMKHSWVKHFVEIGHEIVYTAILSILLIQVGQLSVSGERMCTEYWLNA